MIISKIDFKKIPAKPGVYFYKNKDQKVIYVGKAISLRARIKQYFKGPIGDKTKLMLDKAKSLDFTETGSELEAVIFEAKLIKQYQPHYNVLLKDDKRYLYLGITKNEYPRVKLVRRPELEDLLFWAGPFPSSMLLKQILRWARKIFPYCSCKPGRKRPCLYCQIGLCPDPGVISPAEYKQNIKNIISFFSGKSRRLLTKLQKEMKQEADMLNFEKAGQIKQQIQFLERMVFSPRRLTGENLAPISGLKQLKKIFMKYQNVDPFYIQRIEGYDIANWGEKVVVGSMSVLINGEPEPKEYRRFKLIRSGQDDPRSLSEILSRRLKHEEWLYPQLILIDGGLPQLRAVLPVLQKYQLIGEVCLAGLVKGEEVLIIPKFSNKKVIDFRRETLPKNSAALKVVQLARDEAHRFAQSYLHHKKKLDTMLGQ